MQQLQVYLTDTADEIRTKITKFAFSGVSLSSYRLVTYSKSRRGEPRANTLTHLELCIQNPMSSIRGTERSVQPKTRGSQLEESIVIGSCFKKHCATTTQTPTA
eukprot:84754-Amphidinium_carterae.1